MVPSLTVVLMLLSAPEGRVVDRRVEKGLLALLEQQTEQEPGWPWEKGDNRPAPNTGGLVALTLLRAYEQQPRPATWVTLVQFGHSLRDFYAPSDRLPYKADIEFLARLGQAGVDPTAPRLARALFDRLRQVSPTGQAELTRIAQGRTRIPEIIGYDVALAIRAALAVGERTYAEQLADASLTAGHLELYDSADPFLVTSVGALAHAVSLVDRERDRPALERAAGQLVLGQSRDGSWAMSNTQATAYAVLGLTALAHLDLCREAAALGRSWLLERQLRSGAWAALHGGLPEPFVGPVIPLAEAEALAAVLPPQTHGRQPPRDHRRRSRPSRSRPTP